MTGERRNLILVLVAALQIALIAVVYWPQRGAVGAEGEPLLGEIPAAEIQELQITSAGADVVILRRSGDGWVVPDADDYPASQSAVDELVIKLLAADTDRLIATTPESRRRLKVHHNDFERRVLVTTGSGKTMELLIGTGSGSQDAHVRRTDQDGIYLAEGLATWQVATDLLSWVDPVYFRATPAQLTSLTVTNEHGTVDLSFDAEGGWTLGGTPAEAIDSDAVISFVNSISTIRMTQPLGAQERPAYGLTTPAAVLTVQPSGQAGDPSRTVQFGVRQGVEDRYVAKASDSPFYVEVSSFAIADLLDTRRLDLLAGAPE